MTSLRLVVDRWVPEGRAWVVGGVLLCSPKDEERVRRALSEECEHGVRRDVCEVLQCVVDSVHDL